jgi:carboxymethylenebutenolidase
MTAANSNSDLGALFDGHIAREFADFDVDATMETMVAEPYVHCVATLAGGCGGREVRRFYSEHFINQIPKDARVTPISRTIGATPTTRRSHVVCLKVPSIVTSAR